MGILRLMHMPSGSKKNNRQEELDVALNSAMMRSPVLTPADIYAATGSLRDGTYVAGRANVLVGGKSHIITVVEKGKSPKDIEAKIAKETKGKIVEFASYNVTRSSNAFTGQQTVKIEEIEREAKKEKERSSPTLKRG